MNPFRRLRAVPDAAPTDGDPADSLMARVAKGDQGAFAELYDLLAPRVHAVVLRVLRDPAMAEEVTQEVMVEVWRLAPRYDRSRGGVRTWASTISHRRAVDRVRATQSSRDRDERDAVLGSASPAVDEVAEVVEDRLERERVALAMDSLTDTQRESIELAYWSGYTYREVAAVLDVPEGTVKTRIRDGLIRLRDHLGVGEEADPWSGGRGPAPGGDRRPGRGSQGASGRRDGHGR
ncbi:ECF RNA polymerase sigma factor SigK [Dermatobacter hominis]|uniref:ECF RNA polymerase sigma factor SigK n=1 Tax=Dermatobacter hominis TaxID=2884263 RepID=UPI001D105B2D|nr:ECF RNA polymerase sigma factor SigK [Dermatobacter hominis]UDY34067.1 ECF RNA polymerase sigma factor SigK [Dermatobacter hominis]